MTMSLDVGLSSRGAGNVQTTLEKINAAVEERAKKDNDKIDLGTSENWLIRDELIGICKDAVKNKLVAKVSSGQVLWVPRGVLENLPTCVRGKKCCLVND